MGSEKGVSKAKLFKFQKQSGSTDENKMERLSLT